MKICFLTSAHDPLDDRIFYHMAASLNASGHNIEIVSSKSDLTKTVDGIKLNCFNGDNLPKKDKTEQFTQRLSGSCPEVIICSEPLPIYAAYKFSKRQKDKIRIIYDITEWYPSRKNLCHYYKLVKWYHFIRLLSFNLWVSRFVDSFIFGEWFKSRPYRLLFPGKPFIFTSYYPNLSFIRNTRPEIQNNKLRLSYSGKLNHDKGYDNFIKVIDMLSDLKKETEIEVKIIGWQDSICEKNKNILAFPKKKNVVATFFYRQPFIEYLDLIKDTDIFIDLRSNNFENTHCLPIKLFYYAALERPVIISDLKAIQKEIDINSFGFLVNPSKIEESVKLIMYYIDNPEIYKKHCNMARKIIEDKFNWNILIADFVKFIETVRN
jgi:glycosyltransferase involved in cell wall biosynthesis